MNRGTSSGWIWEMTVETQICFWRKASKEGVGGHKKGMLWGGWNMFLEWERYVPGIGKVRSRKEKGMFRVRKRCAWCFESRKGALGVRKKNTEAQKLSNFFGQCTDVQASTKIHPQTYCWSKCSCTGLSLFNIWSGLCMPWTAWRTHGECAQCKHYQFRLYCEWATKISFSSH